MGKKAKEHRKKILKRNEKINQEKTAYMNMQRKFVEELIRREKENGQFDSPMALPLMDPQISGPQI